MNIKLDLKNKIRLSQEDLLMLKKNQRFEQEFEITKRIRFVIELTIESGLQQSMVSAAGYARSETEKQLILFRLSEDDINKISSGETVYIDDLAIEVDNWSAEKRNKIKLAGVDR